MLLSLSLGELNIFSQAGDHVSGDQLDITQRTIDERLEVSAGSRQAIGRADDDASEAPLGNTTEELLESVAVHGSSADAGVNDGLSDLDVVELRELLNSADLSLKPKTRVSLARGGYSNVCDCAHDQPQAARRRSLPVISIGERTISARRDEAASEPNISSTFLGSRLVQVMMRSF